MSDHSEGEGWWAASDGKWYPPQGDTTDAPVEEPSGGRARRPAVIGVVLVLVVGMTVLIVSLTGGGSSTGASSPEAAFDGIVQAVNDEDALGVVSLIDLEEFGLVADRAGGASTPTSRVSRAGSTSP